MSGTKEIPCGPSRRRCWIVCSALLLVAAHVASPASGEDLLRTLQAQAMENKYADWGFWGDNPKVFSTWGAHSNRLIPIYTFGITLDGYCGPKSAYRSADRIAQLYGRVPEGTLNPAADYCDQTDVYRLQKQAVEVGKKYVIVLVFDGLDWDATRAAAIYYGRKVYNEGRGTGLFMQDYQGTTTDFGFCVTSPFQDGKKINVNAQTAVDDGPTKNGGYYAARGGATPWTPEIDLSYLISKNREHPDAYTDSASSATSLFAGIKTYNAAINVDHDGKPVAPIAHELQKNGWQIGVVTSVPLSHATPAAAYAQNVTRNDYQDLARDMVGWPSVVNKKPLRGVDVLLSAGWGARVDRDPGQGENFIPGNPYVDPQLLFDVDVEHGGKYRLVQRTAGAKGAEVLAAAARTAIEKNERLLGIFGCKPGNLPYQTADGRFDPYSPPAKPIAPGTVETEAQRVAKPLPKYTAGDISENPTLADMTKAALEVLSSRDRPFWLMVEAGDVDWGLHSNNIDNAIGAVHSGDDAFRQIVAWVEARKAWDETAVIVTSDHGHLFVLREPQILVRCAAAAETPPSAEGSASSK